MKRLLLALPLLLCSPAWGQMPVEIRDGRLVFEIGSVQVPEGTEWKKFVEPGKALFVGSREREVYTVTVNKRKGPIPAGKKAEAMQAYAESYAEEVASSLKAQAKDVRSRASERGCEFSFALSNGVKVVGDFRQGKDVVVLFSTLNGSPGDLKAMAASFRPAPGKFKPPVYK